MASIAQRSISASSVRVVDYQFGDLVASEERAGADRGAGRMALNRNRVA